jgi:nucleoid-associated protein EbfC
MFGDLMGNMEQKQQEMRESLSKINVEAEAGDGAVKVTANANRQIINIAFNRELLDWDDTEQVEDLVTVAVNRALESAAAKETEAAQEMMKAMLPPGLDGMGNLFG